MKIIQCDEINHGNQILEIFNYEIINSTALFDYKIRTKDMMKTWFENKKKCNYPVIGVENDEGILMGFVSYGPFRACPAYKYTVEHSLYVNQKFRGNGIGDILMTEIIKAAIGQQYHVIIAGIEAGNKISIKLHEKHKFIFCGKIKHAGYKFGNWLDLDFMQLILKTPIEPNEM
jgi:phosphinothricin acetyltransferase